MRVDVCPSLSCVCNKVRCVKLAARAHVHEPCFVAPTGTVFASRDLLVLVYFISQFVLVYSLDVPPIVL